MHSHAPDEHVLPDEHCVDDVHDPLWHSPENESQRFAPHTAPGLSEQFG